MSEEAYGEGPVGPMILDEAVVVDVADVMPELADPEVVAEIVAPDQGDRDRGRRAAGRTATR